jgi:hypothetical protein
VAIGPTIGAIGGYEGAKSSAAATTDAANTASATTLAGLEQQKELSQPYRDLGSAAIPQLEQLLGLSTGAGGGGGWTMAPDGTMKQIPTGGGGSAIDALRNTPGYQFALGQGLDATKNAATSMGMARSGNTLEALDRFSTGLADQTYQSTIGNLLDVTRIGQGAAAGQAANVGQATSNLSNIAINQGNTIAGIDANLAATLARSGQQASSNAANMGGMVLGAMMGG